MSAVEQHRDAALRLLDVAEQVRVDTLDSIKAPEARAEAIRVAQVHATLDMAQAVREVMEWGETILPFRPRRRRGPQTPREP